MSAKQALSSSIDSESGAFNRFPMSGDDQDGDGQLTQATWIIYITQKYVYSTSMIKSCLWNIFYFVKIIVPIRWIFIFTNVKRRPSVKSPIAKWMSSFFTVQCFGVLLHTIGPLHTLAFGHIQLNLGQDVLYTIEQPYSYSSSF
jgi:hypothetical protein